jgi:hypothetical protein
MTVLTLIHTPLPGVQAAARQQPEVLDGRAHHAVLEVHQDGAAARKEDVAPVQVAVDALELGLGQLRAAVSAMSRAMSR